VVRFIIIVTGNSNNFKGTRNSKMKYSQFNTSKGYLSSENTTYPGQRNSSSNSRGTTIVKEFSSRLMAPTKSSEMRASKTKKYDPDRCKKSDLRDNSSMLIEKICDNLSESQDTPVISFHSPDTSDSQTQPEQDSTPIVSASAEIYHIPDSQHFVEYESPEVKQTPKGNRSINLLQNPYENVCSQRPQNPREFMILKKNQRCHKLSHIPKAAEELLQNPIQKKSKFGQKKKCTSLNYFLINRKVGSAQK